MTFARLPYSSFGAEPLAEAIASWEQAQAAIGKYSSQVLAHFPPDVKARFAVEQPIVGHLVDAMQSAVGKITGGISGPSLPPGVAQSAALALQIAAGERDPVAIASAVVDVVVGALATAGIATAGIGFIGAAAVQVAKWGADLAQEGKISPTEAAGITARWRNCCALRASEAANVVGTGPRGGNVEFADMFRALKNGSERCRPDPRKIDSQYRLPSDFAGIITLLCGDEAKGHGILSFNHTPGLWAKHVAIWGSRGLVIPQHVRRSMWSMVESLLASVRPITRLPGEPILGDNGRVVGLMLLATLRDQWMLGRINQELVSALVDSYLAPPLVYCAKKDQPAAAGYECEARGPCSQAGLRLAQNFIKWIADWDACLQEPTACGMPPLPSKLLPATKKHKSLARSPLAIAVIGKKPAPTSGLAKAAGALALGAGAYVLVKALVAR